MNRLTMSHTQIWGQSSINVILVNGDVVDLLLDRGASDIVLNLAIFAEEGTKIDYLYW